MGRVGLVVVLVLAGGCGARTPLEGGDDGAELELYEDAGTSSAAADGGDDRAELELYEDAGTDSVADGGEGGAELEPYEDAGADSTAGGEELCDCMDNDQDGTVDEDCEDEICEFELTVSWVTPDRASCFIDAPEAGASGVVQFACTGGRVRVLLGEIEFSGSASVCEIALAGGSSFPWQDGCEWESQQTITGRPNAGVLDYAYEEQPLAGDEGCYSSCTGTGEVSVE